MRDYLRTHEGEARLFVVLVVLVLFLSVASPSFLTASNLASLMNNNAINVIWAVGLLVVLISGGIDRLWHIFPQVTILPYYFLINNLR